MQNTRFIKSIKLKNILSFGPEGMELELKPLNVLIGPNASGKSNLIEAIGLLQAAPRNIVEPIRRGGGSAEWIWKGKKDQDAAELEVIVGQRRDDAPSIVHKLSFSSIDERFHILEESLADLSPSLAESTSERYHFKYSNPFTYPSGVTQNNRYNILTTRHGLL